jgi:ribosomal protein L37AE/L43A
MSTTPEPLSEERLAAIEARAKAPVNPQRVGSFENYKELVEHAPQDLRDILAEVRRLREKYEAPGLRCNAGHVNRLPLALWDCPTCGEELQKKLKAAQDLLLERARQAEELLAWNAEARAHLLVAQGGLATAGCCADEAGSRYVAEARHSEAGKIGMFLEEATPAAALELQRARRAVVEASLRVAETFPRPFSSAPCWQAFHDAVEVLERLRDPEWFVEQACPEHKQHQGVRFRWGPPPHHPCPNCVLRPVSQLEASR